jgi:hypothetical protein
VQAPSLDYQGDAVLSTHPAEEASLAEHGYGDAPRRSVDSPLWGKRAVHDRVINNDQLRGAWSDFDGKSPQASLEDRARRVSGEDASNQRQATCELVVGVELLERHREAVRLVSGCTRPSCDVELPSKSRQHLMPLFQQLHRAVAQHGVLEAVGVYRSERLEESPTPR